MENAIQSQLDDIVSGRRQLSLDLRDEQGQPVGMLQPLTLAHLDDADVIGKLTDWRNQNMGNFLSHFVATPERTAHWMRNVLFKARGQMLFLVYAGDRLVGHFGFKDLSCSDVLLDNAMRGDRAGHPKLMVFAGKALVQWLLDVAAVERVNAYVMEDNVASLMMNRQIGFCKGARQPMLKREKNNEIQWELGVAGTESPDARYCLSLSIERSRH